MWLLLHELFLPELFHSVLFFKVASSCIREENDTLAMPIDCCMNCVIHCDIYTKNIFVVFKSWFSAPNLYVSL
jgi:hypothetical protein